jgi:hypothetical protein
MSGIGVTAGRTQRARCLGSSGDGSAGTGRAVITVELILVLIFAHVVDREMFFGISNVATSIRQLT